MNSIIVIEFITVDGVVEDPDGSGGTPDGGWAFRFGPAAVAGDKFKLGAKLDDGALLFGRRTWQLFSTIWPQRADAFSARMNAAPKWVASRTLSDVIAWPNSRLIVGDLLTAVRRAREDRDLILIGSTTIARLLGEHGLVDEYRLLIFPVVLGRGERLFDDGARRRDLQLVSAEQTGPTGLLRMITGQS